jgi:hydroxymethylbilane synthase
MSKIRIGTRGSRLALAQSEGVKEQLQKAHPGHEFELVIIKTTGDRILDAPLSKIGDKGLFTKEIEKELLDGNIQIAVHSMKDMPTSLPYGLTIGAVTIRLDPRDVFISRDGRGLGSLPAGSTVATGSLRRRSQLLAHMPDVTIVDIRGNVHSRLKKMLDTPGIDGIILAHAGLSRLGILDIISEIIHEDVIIPAVGQASLAIQIRDNDPMTREIVASLDDRDSRIAIECERAFLAELGGGCQVPIAGLAVVDGDTVTIRGMAASLDGRTVHNGIVSGPASSHVSLGRDLARKLLDDGANLILEEIYGRSIK